MGRLGNAARKEELLRFPMRLVNPSSDCFSRLIGDLKLHRPLRLFLHDDRPGRDMTALDHVVDVQPYQIAPTQLAVDGEVEQRQFSRSMVQLQSNPDGPDLLQLQRWLLADQLPFVPRYYTPVSLRAVLVAASMNGCETRLSSSEKFAGGTVQSLS